MWDSEDEYNFTSSEFGVVFADREIIDEEEEEEEEEETDDEKLGIFLSDAHAQQVQYNDLLPKRLPGLINDDYNLQSEQRLAVKGASYSSTVVAVKNSDGHSAVQLDQQAGNTSRPECGTSEDSFSSWEKGVVSQVGIPLKRDCQRLRKNPYAEIRRARLTTQVKKWKSNKPWEKFASRYKKLSCKQIQSEFENNFYVSQTEKEFPLAYTLVVYTNAGQVIRLLRSIYRPNNLYCIHPDARQGKAFASFFSSLARCLDNVFVVSKPIKVYYGHISITNSQLNCMHDLEKYPATRWKYVINLCGREIPIKTNREIVENLRKMNGHTVLNLRKLSPYFWKSRFRFKFYLNKKGHVYRGFKAQSKPPHGIKIYKSMNFIAASRAFVRFLLHHPLSIKLRRYLATVYAPEEHFYSSLYALPQAQGARPPKSLIRPGDMPIVDQFIWVNNRWMLRHLQKYCPGRRQVHGICILTAPDLGKIEKLGVGLRQPVFFFNKYFMEWDPTPMDCMEEHLVRTNMEEYSRDCAPDGQHIMV